MIQLLLIPTVFNGEHNSNVQGGKGKGKIYSTIGHEGPEVGNRGIALLFLLTFWRRIFF